MEREFCGRAGVGLSTHPISSNQEPAKWVCTSETIKYRGKARLAASERASVSIMKVELLGKKS